jgi:hypothetical protein
MTAPTVKPVADPINRHYNKTSERAYFLLGLPLIVNRNYLLSFFIYRVGGGLLARTVLSFLSF